MKTTGPFAAILADPPKTQIVGRKILAFDVLDSTNTYALDQGEDGMVVVADRQTAGRGRLGRSWHSAPGLGLWFTAAFDGLIEGLPCIAALAVQDALADRCALRIKWPNDLLCGNKKICGILIEHRNGRTALGIGLNVHHTPEDFPPELREKAGSLQSELGGTWDRCAILRDILNHLDQTVILMHESGFETIRARWAEACDLIGRNIRCGEIEGVVREIDRTGALILDTPHGAHTIHSGDITLTDGN